MHFLNGVTELNKGTAEVAKPPIKKNNRKGPRRNILINGAHLDLREGPAWQGNPILWRQCRFATNKMELDLHAVHGHTLLEASP
jgi:hypothetical protein